MQQKSLWQVVGRGASSWKINEQITQNYEKIDKSKKKVNQNWMYIQKVTAISCVALARPFGKSTTHLYTVPSSDAFSVTDCTLVLS